MNKRFAFVLIAFLSVALIAAATFTWPGDFNIGGILTARQSFKLWDSDATGSVSFTQPIGGFTGILECLLEDDSSPLDPCVTANSTGGRSLTVSGGAMDADQELYEKTKCINVDPAHSTTDWLFFKAERAITVIGIDCIVDAATSVVMTLRECNGDGASCGDTEAAITCAATNTTEASGIDDSAVDAGDWMRITRGSMTGSPTQAILCATYTVND
jgi:hypothetical protein